MIELVGDELYQWDSYRKVKITPKRGYTISCIHFNDGSCILLNDESKDLITITNGITIATIPNTLLQQGGYNITVYAVNIKDGGIETTESRQFYVKKKTKPKDYTYEQSEVASIKSAASYATQAQASAKEAEGYRAAAQTYAGNARDSATSASTSANSANDYKTAAENAKNEILGNGGTYAKPTKESALKEIRSAKTEIVGTTGTAASPNDNSALKEIRNTKTEILGETGTYKDPNNKSALKEIRDFTATNGPLAQAKGAAKDAADSRDAIRSIESNMNTAVEAAGKIDSFRSEITTYHTETKNARNDILSKGADGEKSVYEKIIDAETSINSSKDLIIGSDGLIIGSDGTVTVPGKDSALDKVQKAQEAAEKAAQEAKDAATSANQGIKVVDALDNTSTSNALSANQGKVLNEKIANLNEIYIMKSGETEADVPESVEVIIMPEESGTPYVLTDSDKAEIASLVNNATIVQAPIYVDSVDKMTDTSRVYVLSSTGDIWAYMNTTVTKEITDKITGTTENPYLNGNRLGSDGSAVNDSSEMVLTPYIDIGSYTTYGSITLKLAGIQYIFPSHKTNVKVALYDENKAKIACAESCLDGTYGIGGVIGFAIAEDNSATVTLNLPYSYSGKVVKYIRFNTIGTSEASDISIIYTGEVTGSQWVNTNLKYSPVLTDDEKTSIAEQAAALIDTNLLDLIGDEEVVV